MINEQECARILNEGDRKYTKEEMKKIRDLITTLAEIEYLCVKEKGVKE